MVSGTSRLDEATVLASIKGARRAENQAAAETLQAAVEWARLNIVDDPDEAATWWSQCGGDTGIPIAGEGAPLVSEFAVAELATALGMTPGSGRMFLAQAVELAHRLPRLYARVMDGSLAPWRGRRVAEETFHLSPEAADWVDQMIAPYAHRTGPAQTQRLVQEAIARFMPDTAAEQRERAAEQRYFTIDHEQISFAGTSRVHGELDLADALDLEDAIAAGAAQLAALGNAESLDVRRSLAVGMLARGEQALEFAAEGGFEAPFEARKLAPQDKRGARTSAADEGGFEARSARTSTTARPQRREVVIYAHLSADALGDPTHAADGDPVATVESHGPLLITVEQVAAWCGRVDTTRIVVKPVIDLATPQAVDGYQVPDRIAEQVRLRDRTCVFPFCTRPARGCDLDHIIRFLDPAAGGPPGQTNDRNLACLCRLHHRLKTHGGWSYSMVDLGVYLWRSPYGYRWLRDRDGTIELTPPPVEPPPDQGDPPDPPPRPAG